ncbi:MAG: sialidase family protein, partial [Thermoplasmata archaeon]
MKERMHFVRMIVLCLMAAFLAVAVLTFGASERAQAGTSEPEPLGDAGSGWIFDEGVNFIPNVDVNPDLATGPGGTLHAAWQHDANGMGNWDICYASSVDGGKTWSLCVLVASFNIETNPDIAVSPQDGRIFIAYEMEQVAGNREIFVAYSDDGVGWFSVMVSAGPMDEFNPSITLEHDMPVYRVHVAFEEDVPGSGHDLHVYGSPDMGVSWLPLYDYGMGDMAIYSSPKLEYQRCTDALPRIYMLHFIDSIEVRILWSEDNGMTWLGPGTLWSSPELKGGLTVAASRDGDTLMVAWHLEVPTDYRMEYVYDLDPTTPGAGWGFDFFDTPGLNDRAPELTVDGEGTTSTSTGGRFHMVFTVATNYLYYISVNTDMTGGFSTAIPTDSVASPSPGSPKGLTTQNRGGTWYPAVAWMDNRIGDWDIFYTTPGSRVTVDANITGLYMFVDGQNITLPKAYNWPAGLNHSFDVPSPQNINATARAVWLDWSDTGAQNHSVQATTLDTIYTAGFMFQHRVSFLANPAVGGLQARIDGMLEILPKSYWWFIGSDHEIFAPSPQLDTGSSRWVFDYWSDFGPQLHDITVLGDRTYTCFFIREYYVTIDTNPTGLDVEIDASTYVAPQSFWWEEGSMHDLNAPSPQSGGMGMRYVFLSWSDSLPQSHVITVNGPGTITANFGIQYQIDFGTNPPGLNVEIDTITYPTPQSFWWDEGSMHFIDVVSPQSGGPGVQYVFSLWSDLGPQGHSIVISGPDTLTATFTRQYYLTVTSSYGITNGEGWYDEMTDAYAGLDTDVYVVVPNADRFVFSQWGGDATGVDYSQSLPIMMDMPKTALAIWQEQFYLTVTSPYGVTSGEGWYDSGWQAYAGLDTDVYIAIPNAERFVFTSWGTDASGLDYSQSDPIDMIMPRLATALWTQQFYLTVDSTYGTTFGEGWYDQMTDAYAGLDIDTWVVTPNQERWAFYQWAGDASGVDYLQSDPISMDSAKFAQADWMQQFYLTVQSPYGTTSGEGWYDGGTLAYAGLDIDMYVVTPNAERWLFASWGGDATGANYLQSDPINVDQPMAADAIWQQQFYLTVTSPYGTPSGEGWFDPGATVFAGLDIDLVVIVPNEERYIFSNWGGDAAGSDYLQSDGILMDSPKTADAIWRHEYSLSIQSTYGTPIGEGWFEEMTAVPAGLDIGIYVVTPGEERFVFLQWTGDATGIDYMASDSIVMNGPKTANAQWTHEYYLTVDTSYGTPTGEGWYEDGTEAY